MKTSTQKQKFADPFTTDAVAGEQKVTHVGEVCINCEG